MTHTHRRRWIAVAVAVTAVLPATAQATPAAEPWGDAGTYAAAVFVEDTPSALSLAFAEGYEDALGSWGGVAVVRFTCEDDVEVTDVLWDEDAAFDGDPALADATVTGSGTLAHERYSAPGCADPDYERETHTVLPAVPAQIAADFAPAGDVEPHGGSFHETWLPACLYAGAEAGLWRPADAALTGSGFGAALLNLQTLTLEGATMGTAAFAGAFAAGDENACFGEADARLARAQRLLYDARRGR